MLLGKNAPRVLHLQQTLIVLYIYDKPYLRLFSPVNKHKANEIHDLQLKSANIQMEWKP